MSADYLAALRAMPDVDREFRADSRRSHAIAERVLTHAAAMFNTSVGAGIVSIASEHPFVYLRGPAVVVDKLIADFCDTVGGSLSARVVVGDA